MRIIGRILDLFAPGPAPTGWELEPPPAPPPSPAFEVWAVAGEYPKDEPHHPDEFERFHPLGGFADEVFARVAAREAAAAPKALLRMTRWWHAEQVVVLDRRGRVRFRVDVHPRLAAAA